MSDEPPADFRSSLRRRLPVDPVLAAVLVVTALALAARLYALGWRVMHWDEGRVAYDVLRYAATGEWQYRAIVHGPFLPQVNRVLFETVGASDFVARLPVALVGGLLPLSAWLLRDRLREEEVLALALLLAANPLVLYYSRFMRNDVLVAAFALFAVAFYVRAVDTGLRRHLYAGTLALALAFTAKENALVYVGTWVGAAALLLDYRLLTARAREEDWLTVTEDWARRTGRTVWRWRAPLVLSLVEFLLVVVVFYAPRPEFGRALTSPAMLPGVVEAATVGAWTEFYGQWVGAGLHGHEYVPFFVHYVETLVAGALPLSVLAVVGFLSDRYAGDGPRDLVAFASYWGFVSVLVYPLITDIQAAWSGVHTVVPLAVPAAVGLGLVYRWGVAAVGSGDRVGVALAAVALFAVAGNVAVTAADTTYLHPQDRGQFAQYGQPAGEMKPALADVHRATTRTDGEVDVLFYGEHFYVRGESSLADPRRGNWFHRLPLPWYLERYGANVTSAQEPSALEGDLPPVVMTRRSDRETVEPHLDGYTARTYLLTQDIPGNQVYLVVYVDEDALGG